MKTMPPVTITTPAQFSVIDGKERTAWNMLDGNVMTGILVQDFGSSFVVCRPDGSSCKVPSDICRPATLEDVETSIRFFSQIRK